MTTHLHFDLKMDNKKLFAIRRCIKSTKLDIQITGNTVSINKKRTTNFKNNVENQKSLMSNKLKSWETAIINHFVLHFCTNFS